MHRYMSVGQRAPQPVRGQPNNRLCGRLRHDSCRGAHHTKNLEGEFYGVPGAYH